MRQEALEKWVDLLQKCRRSKDLDQAKRLLACLRRHSLESHPLVGNYLVPTLVDCGDVPLAHQVFDSLLPHSNEHSWTSLISGYLHHGNPHLAFLLYHRMHAQPSPQPNACTYFALLAACARLHLPESGHFLHSELAKRGLDTDLRLSCALVDLYTKCSSLTDAYRVFAVLPRRDASLWNVLIAAYAEHGLSEEAGRCFQQMQVEGISPDMVTFLSSLKACVSTTALKRGRELHMETVKRGLEVVLHLGSTFVDMYTKCGSLAEARQVFDALPIRNEVSWNAVIAGYTDNELEEAGICIYQMELEGISPTVGTFISSLKACGSTRALEAGRQMHAELMNRGLEKDLHVGTTLMDMYTNCSSLAEAQEVFEQLPVRNSVSWNTLITGYAEHGLDKEVGNCFQKMLLEGTSPDSVTFVCSLKACSNLQDIQTGMYLHTEATRRGFEKDSFVGSVLVDMYTKCGLLPAAQLVFDKLPSRDAVLWASLIAGYAEHGHHEDVLKCFKQMQQDGVPADTVTCMFCLIACRERGALETGQEIHAEIRKLGSELDPTVGNVLVDMYGRCGLVEEGREVFDMLSTRDVGSWTAIIKAYGENHEGNMAVQCFEDMQKQCVKPNSLTFTCLLAACSHGSLVLKGQEYFKTMTGKYQIEPSLEHYACMVDLLARSGHVQEAERFQAAMKCPPSSLTVMALLAACKSYGELDVGERCFKKLVEVDREDSSPYLLMADMYANTDRWKDANSMEEMRTYAEAMKKPGSALIEVNKQVHEFIVGVDVDQGDALLEMFELFSAYMRNDGYIPNVNVVLRQSPSQEEELSCNEFFHLRNIPDRFQTCLLDKHIIKF